MSSRKLSALRACGADDGTANRTPSAWMISLALFFLPNGKSCSSCGSLLVSGNGLFLPSAVAEFPPLDTGHSIHAPTAACKEGLEKSKVATRGSNCATETCSSRRLPREAFRQMPDHR